ncbi:DNA-binding GntR family transcriptional regulator [Catenuloplanes nepalensis]|uniref:DNA-binding GntR family transcriptional regulator n=1 Tax=Catenuloplanes nepalensis TaxID=587533 RepID=A0ABT9MKV4_9ACTN|nr:GntR family transcriptional regulator [Catenuloplanes nepalensis]MDP9791691.1 DNA-binding GntR family transcriptional regulator [Catenuloplanes nepalensis]
MEEWGTRLAGDRVLLDRGSTAERVADILRERITEGVFKPGTRLSEESLREALGISRNTLREAFRLLAHEGLLEHQLNRGVFVRLLTSADIRDLYAIRRILECGALRDLDAVPAPSLDGLRTAIETADEAASRGDWSAVGTANMRFHQAIADLAGSRRVAETVRALLAELRLVFLVVADPRALHEPYVAGNRALYELLAVGDVRAAEEALRRYLADAETQLLGAYAAAARG